MVFERFVNWLDSASDEDRVQAAGALAAAYLRSNREGEEGEVAEAVITALADDPSIEVREILAEAFADQPAAPRHVIASLAADLPQIASVVLSRSPLFVDGELIEFVANGAPEHQIAIACRPNVSIGLAAAIGEVGELEACIGLLSNKGARMAPAALHRIAERFGEDAEVRRLLFRQPALAPKTHVLLIERLAGIMAKEVMSDSSLPAGRIEALLRDNCDRALISFAALAAEENLPQIVEAIVDRGSMTASLLLRAVCVGNISLFANGLARLAKVSLSRVETALADDKRTVFRALYDKAGLPDSAFAVFSDAIACWRRLLADADGPDLVRMPLLVTREVLAAYDARPQQKADSQMDLLLVLLRKLAAEASRQNARRTASRGVAEANARPAVALPSPDTQPASREAVASGPGETLETRIPEDQVAEAQTAETGEMDPMDVTDQVIAEYALHFAEEIAELEEELTAATLAGAADRIWLPEAPALDDALSSALSDDEIIAAIDFDGMGEPVAPGSAANDIGVAPPIHAMQSGIPKLDGDEPVSVLIGIARSQLKSRQAA